MPSEAVKASGAHIAEQTRLLRMAEETGEALAITLERAGWSYDDLIYENSKERVWKGDPPISLADLRAEDTHVPVVSFFSGCGGMDLGFEAAGFKHIAAFEINELFCKTLR